MCVCVCIYVCVISLSLFPFSDDLIGLFDGSSSPSDSLSSPHPASSSVPSSFDTTASLLPAPSSAPPPLLAIMDAPVSSSVLSLPPVLASIPPVNGWNKKVFLVPGHN